MRPAPTARGGHKVKCGAAHIGWAQDGDGTDAGAILAQRERANRSLGQAPARRWCYAGRQQNDLLPALSPHACEAGI